MSRRFYLLSSRLPALLLLATLTTVSDATNFLPRWHNKQWLPASVAENETKVARARFLQCIVGFASHFAIPRLMSLAASTGCDNIIARPNELPGRQWKGAEALQALTVPPIKLALWSNASWCPWGWTGRAARELLLDLKCQAWDNGYYVTLEMILYS